MTDDQRLRAIIAASQENERTNPAVAADVQYKPYHWTPADEAELVERVHGDERERIDKLIAEFNQQQRHR